MSKLRIGLLNFSRIESGNDPQKSIQDLLEYVQLADNLGFSRFWLGEHQLYRGRQSWTNPEMLLPLLAGTTKKIKVGIAGSLISIHNPLDVATNFKMLANLFPDRIDLGLAKGGFNSSGGNPLKGASTIKYTGDDIFARNVEQVASYLREESRHFENGLVIPPLLGEIPDIFLLGSSYKSTEFALQIGANFSRSLFHLSNNREPDILTLSNFDQLFFDKYFRHPEVNLAIAVCCSGRKSIIKTVLELYSQKDVIELDSRGVFAGSPHKIYDEVQALQQQYRVNEFIILQLFNKQSDRLKGLELIAKEFDL